jgi:predicted HicB family RNase H-like nuclease
METKMLQVRLPEALHAKLKVVAAIRKVSLRALIEKILQGAVQ